MNKRLMEIMQSGNPFQLDDPAFLEINEFKDRTLRLSVQLNASVLVKMYSSIMTALFWIWVVFQLATMF